MEEMEKTKFCKHCGAKIPEDAIHCPSCGQPVNGDSEITGKQKKKRKKHTALWIVIAVIAVLIIIGVNGGTNEPKKVADDQTGKMPSSQTEEVASAQTEQPTQAADFTVGDKIDLNNICVTLVNVTESTGGNYMTPSDGKVFVLCEFEIENNSDRDIAVSSLVSFEAYVDDYTTTMSFSATASSDKTQLDGSVAAGKKMNGVIGYEVDADWKEIEIRFTPDFWAGKDVTFVYSK